jgi:hypothetical protein
MELMSLDTFVKKVNLERDKFQPGDIFDIQDLGYYTNSFNFKTGEIEKKKILNIKYQGPKEVFEIRTKEGLVLLKTSSNHHLYDFEKMNWIEVGKEEFVTLKINLKNNEDLVKCVIVKTNESKPMYDLEIEDNHNYFTNGILSKNCTGGYAVNFYPSSRFRVTPKDQITRSGEIIGITMKIKNYKNKTGIPFRECLLDVYFRDGEDFKSGIDGEGQYIDMLVELGEITQHGAWYYYHEGKEDMQRFQGMAGTRTWFKEHPDEFAKAKKVVNDLMSQHSALDKDTLETDEMEDVKQDETAAVEKRQENTSILAEQALQEGTEPEE